MNDAHAAIAYRSIGTLHSPFSDIQGMPVLDIEPSVPHFDVWPAGWVGWFAAKAENAVTYISDDRFR